MTLWNKWINKKKKKMHCCCFNLKHLENTLLIELLHGSEPCFMGYGVGLYPTNWYQLIKVFAITAADAMNLFIYFGKRKKVMTTWKQFGEEKNVSG